MSFADFRPSNAVSSLHEIPRFGHTSCVAALASSDASAAEDYKDGIIAFCIFLGTICLVWTIVLLVLKFYYGVDRVGWAAGGEIVDIKHLKKHWHLSKLERKRRIVRNWRVQNACLLACITLLPFSILMLRLGLEPFIASLGDVQQINDLIDSRAYRGIHILTTLSETHDKLKNLSHSEKLEDAFEAMCPEGLSAAAENLITNYNNATTTINNSDNDAPLIFHGLASTAALEDTVRSGIEQIDSFIADYNIASAVETLYLVTDASAAADNAIDDLYSYDWVLKLFVVLFDVVVVFLMGGIFFTKNNCDYPAYQRVTYWFFLPLFCLLLAAILVGTCVFAAVAIVNADFCAGGEGEGSPLETIRDIIVHDGYNADTLPYQALDYYGSDCLTENPLIFLNEIESQVSGAHFALENLYSTLTSDNIPTITSACDTDSNSIVDAGLVLQSLINNVSDIRMLLTAAIELIDCSSINPIFRRLFYGSTCTQSVQGLTWLFSALLVITIMGFVALTTRAAFFNPIIRGRRRKRRDKEFEDYKLFMSRFYGDTSDWTLDFIPDLDCYDDEPEPRATSRNSDCTHSTTNVSPSASVASDDDEEDDNNSDNSSLVAYLSGVAPTASTDGGATEFVNLSAPDDDYIDDDDDDSYDSTYSVDIDEEDLASVGATSTFSRMFLTRRNHNTSTLGEMNYDDRSEVNSRAGMLLNAGTFFLRNTFSSLTSGGGVSAERELQHNEDDVNSDLSSDGGSVLSNFRRWKTFKSKVTIDPSASTKMGDDGPQSNNKLPSNHANANEGAMMSPGPTILTPQALRMMKDPLSLGRSGAKRRFRLQWDDDPDELEMEPLTPSPEQIPPEDSLRTRDQFDAPSKRFTSYARTNKAPDTPKLKTSSGNSQYFYN